MSRRSTHIQQGQRQLQESLACHDDEKVWLAVARTLRRWRNSPLRYERFPWKAELKNELEIHVRKYHGDLTRVEREEYVGGLTGRICDSLDWVHRVI